MADDVYSGWQTYVIIERQTVTEDSYFSAGCPVRNPSTDASGNIIALNGIVFVNPDLPAPHDSFSNFIGAYATFSGWVLDLITGEFRYYDGTQADETEYWAAEKRAIGKCNRLAPKNTRPVDFNTELGQMFPASLSAHEHENTFTLEKLYCDKKKKDPLDPSRTSPVIEQLGFLGPGVVEQGTMMELIQPGKQDYYMMILYTLDYDDDSDNIARVWISPCTYFESYEITDETQNTVNIRLEGKSTYSYTIPLDHSNIVANNPTLL